ncbi:NAD(P)/FAD-dependent oxidoreductase [Christiangramia salexigens]|uniref:Pyridine nucleotide-disulfide oxidoreductase n=1 Tax=Christiangramia salexigens TaxID=1913577 RepID=A0A1L3J2Z6_9FLAO|nr:NAD(P)/FAD-dependent oxidoreductase [Christiangramia salexigens]APG59499.1 pyridine nucleotide-disulfide oxidoreductase [Christiangramia salexigens]
MKKTTDILIIGAGPSGMVAAGYLNQHNISIQVVEKQKFPRFTIGESLIPRCMDNFEEAGLLDILKSRKYQKKYGARFIKKDKVAEFDFSKKFGIGWDWTWQVPRADFDYSLAREIESRGVDISYNTKVISVNRSNELWTVDLVNQAGNTSTIQCKFIIDASGNGRVLAKQLDLEAPPKVDGHSSIFTHIKEESRPQGKEGELITFEIIDHETWFWYIPFSDGTTSLGFVGPDFWIDQFSESTEVSFGEMLKETSYYQERFDHYDFLFTPVKLRNIAKNVTTTHGEGFVLTGNSAEFLDPVFSSGVAFATESGLLAAKLSLRQLRGVKVNWDLEYAEYINRGVEVFSTYVKEWYSGKLQDIFFFPEQDPAIKEQICSVLAGYVWDKSNPFVRNHARRLKNLHQLIKPKKIL